VIRYEGPKGGPGMPEMLTPTSAIMGAGLGKVISCARQLLLQQSSGCPHACPSAGQRMTGRVLIPNHRSKVESFAG